MKAIIRLLIATLLILVPALAQAAGSCAVTNTVRTNVTIVTAACTGDSSNGSWPAALALGTYRGWIVSVETKPGTTNPTASWGATILNASSRDVMGGAITARSASAAQMVTPASVGFVDGPITITITGNSVASALITFKILIYREP